MTIESFTNYINGESVEPADNNYLDTINPATGKVYARVPNSSVKDLERAVSAAEGALSSWKKLSLEQRSAYLNKVADLIEAKLDDLALAESEDNGKPLSLAKSVDIPRAAANFRFFAQACTQFASEAHAMSDRAINYTLRDPIGIVACISPWNLPLYLFTWKIAPALAAGNCVIAKPSEITPKTAFLLGEICKEANLPAGVLNILHGEGKQIGNAICAHPKIKAISFTGGTKTGAHIAQLAAPMFKKLSLELGGKNPALVFADCDLDKTVNAMVRTIFSNQGQICLCASRIYVERSIYDSFKEKLLSRIKQLKVGDPLEDVALGAVVSKAHMDKVLGYVELAQKEGGTVLYGGQRVHLAGRCGEGFFIEPTLIEGLPLECRTNQEEIFGPVATLQPFDSEKDALKLANGTDYGLAATLWTTDLNRAHRLIKSLEFGIVWVNCWLLRDLRTPFGGMKQSGVGREGGTEALRFFTEAKNACIQYGE